MKGLGKWIKNCMDKLLEVTGIYMPVLENGERTAE